MIGRLRSWITETRAADPVDYTAQQLAAIQAAARVYDGVRATGPYVAALNFIESSAAIAELEGQFAESLKPHLGSIARSLVDRGESTWLIEVDTEGRMILLPCSISNVTGSAHPVSWTYSLNRAGPSETLTLDRPAAAVLAFTAHVDPKRPWRGRPALEASNGTGALLSSIEKQMATESRFEPARVISIGTAKEQQTGVSTKVSEGGVVTLSGGSLGSKDAAYGLKSGVIRNETSTSVGALHSELSRLVSGALGVPPDLIGSSASEAGGRESFRRFAASTCSALLEIIRIEWESKIGQKLEISMEALRAGDITARGRVLSQRATAFKNFVAAGLDIERALSLSGLDE